MNLLDTSTLTNQSIAASTLLHTYVSTKNCMVMVRVFIDQLSANTGARQVWINLKRGGVGSEYRVHLITQNASIVSTLTSIFSYYGPIPLADTDQLKVWAVGVAGDTTTTDIITEIWEENYALDTVWTSTKAGYLDAPVSTVDTVVDAINTRLPADPASESLLETYISTETTRLATSAALGVVASVVSTIDGNTSNLPTAAEIDTQLSGTHGVGTWGNATGGGAVATTVAVTVSSLPRDGVEVWVTTDEAGLNLVANGVTDALGEVDFMLDAGTYYVWKQLSGVNFTNPQTMVVS